MKPIWLGISLIMLVMAGCNFVSIEIRQSSILDKGDGTNDDYVNRSSHEEKSEIELRNGL